LGEFDSYLLQNVDCPALLLDLGNLANTAEEDFMYSDENIERLSQDLFNAIKAN